jgi:hypothetical protein
MKNILLLFCYFLLLQQGLAQYTLVPDPNFEQALIDLGIDSEGTLDGQFLTADALDVIVLDVRYKNINDLTGLEAFVDLHDLLASNNNLTTIDLSVLPSTMWTIRLNNNNFSILDLTPLTNVVNLFLGGDNLTTLSVPNLPNLFSLAINNVPLMTSLSIGNCPNLYVLQIVNTSFEIIDLSPLPNLGRLDCYDSQIQSLDFTNNPNLEEVYASNSSLSSINLPNNPNLEILDIDNCQLTELDVTNCTSLWYLSCGTNSLTNLDLTGNILLEEVRCWENQLTTLDLSQNPNINLVSCFDNLITAINLTNTFNLDTLGCHINPLEELININDCENLRTLYSVDTQLSNLDLSQNPLLFNVTLDDNPNLEFVNLKNGNNEVISTFFAFNCPQFSCLVVDDPLADNDNIFVEANTILVDSVEDCNLSINENELQNLIDIYPNPVIDVLFIKNNTGIKIERIAVYNILGKVVLRENNNFNNLNLSDLTSGILFVKIETENGIITKKIIKE